MNNGMDLWACHLCCLQKNCKSSLGSSPAQVGCEVENGEQGGWNMGQDDSAVDGKHLPPSPRRQASSRSLPVRPPLSNDHTNEENPRNSLPETPKVQLSVPCDTDKPSSSQLSPGNRQPAGCRLSRKKVLSRKIQRPSQEHAQQKAASGQPSVLVPWEREKQPKDTNMKERGNETQEKGLLEEIESMCRMSMALKSNEELTHIRNDTSLDESWENRTTLTSNLYLLVFTLSSDVWLFAWSVYKGDL